RHGQPDLPLPVVWLRDPRTDVHRHDDLPSGAGAGQPEAARRRYRRGVRAAHGGGDLARRAAARGPHLAGAVGDVGPARRRDVRDRARGAALADSLLVRLAWHDQLLGLPAAPARLRLLPLGPRAAPRT